MANPIVQTAPAHEPVTLDELKQQQNIPLANLEDDALLWRLIRSARNAAETATNIVLVTQTLEFTIDRFPPADWIRLKKGRLQSITSLTYTDSADVSLVFAASNYDANTSPEPGKLVLKDSVSWPSVTLKPQAGIVIRYVAGYGTGDQVLEEIRSGILMHAGARWNWREATNIPEEKPQEAFDIWGRHFLADFGPQPGTMVA